MILLKKFCILWVRRRYSSRMITQASAKLWESVTKILKRITFRWSLIIIWLRYSNFNLCKLYSFKMRTINFEMSLKNRRYSSLKVKKSWIKRDNLSRKWAPFKKIFLRLRSNLKTMFNRTRMKPEILNWSISLTKLPLKIEFSRLNCKKWRAKWTHLAQIWTVISLVALLKSRNFKSYNKSEAYLNKSSINFRLKIRKRKNSFMKWGATNKSSKRC